MENTSGIYPKSYVLLIKLDKVADTSAGGIALSAQTQEVAQLHTIYATVVDVGPGCWNDEKEPRAKIGDHIIFAKLAGEAVKGKDGEMYRLITDKQVLGLADTWENK